MKKIGILILSILLVCNLRAQNCDSTFESNYLKISICNDNDWEIQQTLPFIKIKTPEVETFITIFSEPYQGKDNSKELIKKSFSSDKETYPTIIKNNEEDVLLDGVNGTLYSAQVPGKVIQITTFILVHNGRKFTINNNCYSNCEHAEQAVKNVIANTKFQKIESPKLTDDEILAFEKFKLDLHSAFQSEESQSFEKMLVTQPLMIELYKSKIKDETMKQSYVSILTNNWDYFSKKYIAESKASYSKLIANGNDLGINWKKIVLIGVDYSLDSKLPGLISAKCKYKFSYNGRNYEIVIDDVQIINNAWFILEMDTSTINET